MHNIWRLIFCLLFSFVVREGQKKKISGIGSIYRIGFVSIFIGSDRTGHSFINSLKGKGKHQVLALFGKPWKDFFFYIKTS